MTMMSLNVLLERNHSTPVMMLQGEHNVVRIHQGDPSEKGKEPERTGTYTRLAPLQTPTDVENCLMQTAQRPFLIQDSQATMSKVTLVMLN